MMYRVAGFVLAVLFMSACSNPSNSTEEKKSGDLAVETREWVNTSDGYFQYYTNDWNKHYSYQSVGFNSTLMTPWAKLEGAMRKKSGSPDGLFGLMVLDDNAGNYFRIVLDCHGNYAILRIKNGLTDKTITSLTRGSHLRQGIGVETSFKIESAQNGDVNIYFNGQYEDKIASVDLGSTTGGRAGFWIDLTKDYIDFPNIPCCVEYKITAPVTIP